MQVWLSEHLYSKKHIGKSLFNKTLPYLEGIQGQARARLLSQAQAILDRNDDDDKEEEAERQEGNEELRKEEELDEEGREAMNRTKRKRAKKVIGLLST